MKRNILLALGLALGLSGCSTIVHGPYQDVRIESDPPGATATISAMESQRGPGYLDEKQTITTPAVVRLRRDNNYRIDFEKSGYGMGRSELVSHYDWFWGQVTCGLCEALGDIPDFDTAGRNIGVRMAAGLVDYPKGFIAAWGKGMRIFSPDALLGSTFNLKPKDAGFWSNFHALGTPEVTGRLSSK